MRQHVTFDCDGAACIGSIDEAVGSTGLLIVSGGNEIRCGAHGGQSAMASALSLQGFPVFRFDRRGIGDSAGENTEFEGSSEDIAAALATFRKEAPKLKRIVAFGNCDAASALVLFHAALEIDGLILANPWVIDTQQDSGNGTNEDAPSQPSAAAIRARYWARIKNPRSIIDLLTGKINLRKLAGGLSKASQKEAPSALAEVMAEALGQAEIPVKILIAQRDNAARAFIDAWRQNIFADARAAENIDLAEIDSASHSFANQSAKSWLHREIQTILAQTK